jgi:hypothetical protein
MDNKSMVLVKNKGKKSFWQITIIVMTGIVVFLTFSFYRASKKANSLQIQVKQLQTQIDQLIAKQPTYSAIKKTNSEKIYQKYQEIIDQLSELQKREFEDEEIKSKIETLTKEIHELRVLNPYYRFKEIKNSFIPSGIPEIYGEELNVSFDLVQDAINKVRLFDPTYGQEGKKIVLKGAELERYIKIASQTACQYCCGAKTLVDSKGNATCGCAHSAMMRGLAAYLIKNYPELSDEQILKELSNWKIAFFPKQTLSAKLQEMEKAGEAGIKEILEEFPEFLPQMVGGC